MTATDELRRMLDERGVEHFDGYDYTEWDADGIHYIANDHLRLEGRMVLRRTCTPEQAIEATLGETPTPPPPTPPEQPPYDVLIDILRDEWDIEVMWDGLRRFWYVGLTDEGVRKRDEREAMLRRGTCRPTLHGCKFVEDAFQHVFEAVMLRNDVEYDGLVSEVDDASVD